MWPIYLVIRIFECLAPVFRLDTVFFCIKPKIGINRLEVDK